MRQIHSSQAIAKKATRMSNHTIPHMRFPGGISFGTLALLTLGAMIALVAWNPSEPAVIAAIMLLVAVCVVSLLIAKGYEFKRLGISPQGLILEIDEVKQKQTHLSGDVGTLGVAIVGLRTIPEREHLEALAGGGKATVLFRRTLVDELDRLENSGNIASTDSKRRIRDALWAGPGKKWVEDGEKEPSETPFNLKDYARITKVGKQYLAAFRKYRKYA